MQLKFKILLVIFGMSLSAHADHLFGGYLGFKTIDANNGIYGISMRTYIDMNRLTFDPIFFEQYAAKISIYRKRDHKFMETIDSFFRQKNDMIFENVACASQRNFRIVIYDYFSEDLKLDPNLYNDPEGYYLSFDSCCRNSDIDNIVNPGRVSYVFYSEFPPLLVSGKRITYNSPEFNRLNGDYICKNKSFDYMFSANKIEEGNLEYSLDGPNIGVSTYDTSLVLVSPGPYKYPTYVSGFTKDAPFGLSGTIPSVNKNSGELQLKASQDGLYSFSVVVKHFIGGRQVGLIKHDFQLPVVTCDLTKPPDPKITINNVEATEIGICPGDKIELAADTDNSFNYQWQIDGINLEDANKIKIDATEFGEYTVVKSFKSRCSEDATSKVFNLKPEVPIPEILTKLPQICNSEFTTLKVKALLDFKFNWTYNKTLLATGDSIKVNKPGWYYVNAEKSTSSCKSKLDSILVESKISKSLPIPSNSYQACVGDSISLATINENNYNYEWFRDNIFISSKKEIWVKETGTFHVKVTDDLNCIQKSPDYKVSITTIPALKMDPLRIVCRNTSQPFIALYAEPSGGVFSGPGVELGKFYPLKANVGDHEIVYSYKSSPTCSAEIKGKIKVKPDFIINITPKTATINIGDNIELIASNSDPSVFYHWHPDEYLNDHNSFKVIANPVSNIVYVVNAIDSDGCATKESVTIYVNDPNSAFNQTNDIFIPEVFTPNEDGKNDNFIIEAKPGVEFLYKIFDRWGNIIFDSIKSGPVWNGKMFNIKEFENIGSYVGKVEYSNTIKNIKGEKYFRILIVK